MPDFNELLKVLRCEKPSRPVMFEFALGTGLIQHVTGETLPSYNSPAYALSRLKAFEMLGYDYVPMGLGPCAFRPAGGKAAHTRSLNEAHFIYDQASLDAFAFPDPDAVDTTALEAVSAALPQGMKVVVTTPGGVLENAIELIGYDNLCIMLYDEPALLGAVCDRIGSILYRYFQRVMTYDAVGAIVYNDDWGFVSQTLIAPEDLRSFIFPWVAKIVSLAKAHGRPAILHSCGQLEALYGDIIGMGFAGKHSYEDKIWPVEQAYESLKGNIAVLGGIDLDFLVRAEPRAIAERAAAMLERTRATGGYALGSGNSIPDYIPPANYLAMVSAAGVRL